MAAADKASPFHAPPPPPSILHIEILEQRIKFFIPQFFGQARLVKNKNPLDAAYYFIVLLIGLICFGHCYAHHQELATMMLITTLVVSFLVCCRLEVR